MISLMLGLRDIVYIRVNYLFVCLSMLRSTGLLLLRGVGSFKLKSSSSKMRLCGVFSDFYTFNNFPGTLGNLTSFKMGNYVS